MNVQCNDFRSSLYTLKQIHFTRLLGIIVALLILTSALSVFADEQVTIIAGGDIEWSRRVRGPEVVYLPFGKPGTWMKKKWKRAIKKLGFNDHRDFKTPHIVTTQSHEYLKHNFGIELDKPNSHHVSSIRYDLKFETAEERDRYPFQKIRPILQAADIAFANLETPLADKSRCSRAFRTPTSFAKALKWAGIDLVSTANNHALDAEGEGLLETHDALSKSGIRYVGSGLNLLDARRPVIYEIKGIRIAFLGYAHLGITGRNDFALENRSGVMPLDPLLLEEDIKSIRNEVDFVILSFHWDTWGGGSLDIHPAAKELAHFAIDAGADVIFGHHVHLPRGVELFKGKVIFYSLGNFLFGHNHKIWTDNYLARVLLSKNRIENVEIIPISGKGKNLSQPGILEGKAADNLLQQIKNGSESLGTNIRINENVGIVAGVSPSE